MLRQNDTRTGEILMTLSHEISSDKSSVEPIKMRVIFRYHRVTIVMHDLWSSQLKVRSINLATKNLKKGKKKKK